jgi:hypothetical protein
VAPKKEEHCVFGCYKIYLYTSVLVISMVGWLVNTCFKLQSDELQMGTRENSVSNSEYRSFLEDK